MFPALLHGKNIHHEVLEVHEELIKYIPLLSSLSCPSTVAFEQGNSGCLAFASAHGEKFGLY